MKSRSEISIRSSIIRSVLFCTTFTAVFILFSVIRSLFSLPNERLIHGLTGTIAALLTTLIFLRFDRKQFKDINFTFDRKTVFKFIGELALGVVIMGSLAFGVIYTSESTLTLNPQSNLTSFLIATIPLIPLAFMEEVGFRAYPLEILKNKVDVRLTLIITTVLFALYHIVNGWTVTSSFVGPGVWGLLFGLGAVYFKGIAFPTGLHYAANLTTSAFTDKANESSIWIIHSSNTTSVNNADVTAFAPNLILLLFAVVCIELYMRTREKQPEIISIVDSVPVTK